MKKQLGFTITEVIVVVAVLAVVLTMATPDISKIFAKQSEMTEKIRLRKIHESLDIYAKREKKLPASSNWANELVKYSELSVDQIKNDVWDTPRRYWTGSDSESYLGGNYKVHYAVLISNGLNRVSEESLPTSVAQFANVDFSLGSANPSSDDLIIKYTDQANKLDLLDITLSRMEKLALALEKYARVKQITGIDKCPDQSDSFIYFPSDGRPGDDGDYFNGTKASSICSGSVSVSAEEGVDTIPSQMQATSLAETLGLPSEYGEDALTDNTMWYVSNPGPNGANICNNERESAPYYPPVIIVSDSSPC